MEKIVHPNNSGKVLVLANHDEKGLRLEFRVKLSDRQKRWLERGTTGLFATVLILLLKQWLGI